MTGSVISSRCELSFIILKKKTVVGGKALKKRLLGRRKI